MTRARYKHRANPAPVTCAARRVHRACASRACLHSGTCRRVHSACARRAAPSPVSSELPGVRATLHYTVDDSQRHHFAAYQTSAEERLAQGCSQWTCSMAVNTIVHEGRGLNMTLDAHSFELVHQKTFFTITPRKSQRSTMLRWLRCSRGSHARHTLTSSISSSSLTDTTLTVTDLTHLQLPPRLTLPDVFSLLRGTQPTSTMCLTAGAQALTMSSLMWYPCLSGPALHCRVPFSPFVLVFLQKHRSQAFRSFLLTVPAIEGVCCLVLSQEIGSFKPRGRTESKGPSAAA